MILKERGSTGTKGIAQRSGVIDSGYRGEYMAPVTNLNTKRVVIKKQDVEYKEDAIIYPYEKAICQGVLLRMPQLESEEIPLKNFSLWNLKEWLNLEVQENSEMDLLS